MTAAHRALARPAPAGESGVRGPSAATVSLAGLALVLFGQVRLDAAPDKWGDSLVLVVAGLLCWVAAGRRQVAAAAWVATQTAPGPRLEGRRARWLVASAVVLAVAGVIWPAVVGPGGLGFLDYPEGPDSGANNLTAFGILAWGLAVATFLAATAEHPAPARLRWLAPDGLQLRVAYTAVALLGVMAVGAYFRFTQLAAVPLEMTSDHTEKLKDVASVLDGLRPVFFYGNAGREPVQFYWTALLVRLGLPNDFTTLKVGMGLISLLTIPLVYAVGRRVGGRLAGLMAALALALAPWHLQITRTGLRIALSPLFVAAALILLLRALESGRRNDWLLAGLVAAGGVYGYTGFRPMALVIPAVIALRWGYGRRRGEPGVDRHLAGHLLAAAGVAVAVLAPLLRYAADRPQFFWLRTFTRVTGAETAIPGPIGEVLLRNWNNALLMFNFTSDSAWFQSPAGRPAFETVGGALFILGVAVALMRARRGDWRAAAMLVALPLLLTSSALSLAFPRENPSLSRAAGAIVPAVVLIGLAPAELARRLHAHKRGAGAALCLVVVAGLFVAMARNTTERYFGEYRQQYNQSTHPTRAYAQVIGAFNTLGGDLDHAYLVGWAHGPDFRAIGELAGDLDWNGLLWSGADGAGSVALADAHTEDPARKLYLVGGPLMEDNRAHLLQLYPGAIVTHHDTGVAGKDFYSVLVPGAGAP